MYYKLQPLYRNILYQFFGKYCIHVADLEICKNLFYTIYHLLIILVLSLFANQNKQILKYNQFNLLLTAIPS